MNATPPPSRPWTDLAALVALVVGVAALYGPLFWRVRGLWDIQLHTEFAQRFAQTGEPPTAHFLYHAMLISLTDLGLGWEVAATALVTLAQCLSAALLYALARGLGEEPKLSPLAALGLSVALVLVGPLWLVRLPLPDMAFGWIMPTTLHSPTQVWLRPLALAVFVALSRALQGWRFPPLALFGAVVAALLCVWMKPNYALCALPVLVPLVAWRRYKREPLDLRALGLIAGTLVVSLALQFAWLRAHEGSEHGFALAPLKVVSRFSPSAWVACLKVALSLPFPALALGLLWRKLDPNTRVESSLAALACGVGIAQMLLLTEIGPRIYNGNWFWGAQVALWVWFAAAARALALQPSAAQTRLLWALLALHALCGALYVAYALLMRNPFFDMLVACTR